VTSEDDKAIVLFQVKQLSVAAQKAGESSPVTVDTRTLPERADKKMAAPFAIQKAD
jgi:hypothetical protein